MKSPLSPPSCQHHRAVPLWSSEQVCPRLTPDSIVPTETAHLGWGHDPYTEAAGRQSQAAERGAALGTVEGAWASWDQDQWC